MCSVEDKTNDACIINIQGPLSRSVLQKLTKTDLSDEAFPFSTNKLIQVTENSNILCLRLTFVGELGYELHVPNVSAVSVYNAIMEAGAQYGIMNAGYRAIDSLSAEKGYRHWHSDIRGDDTPLEAGLEHICKLKTNVPFMGRTALEEQKNNGLTKRLMCFTIEQKTPLFGLETIYRDGKCVGFLRSGDYAFYLEKPIGYGYVTHPNGGIVTTEYLKSGNWEVESLLRRYPATLHFRSPFDKNNKRVKGEYPTIPSVEPSKSKFIAL